MTTKAPDDLGHYMQACSKLRAALNDACDVAIWMSGSSSFSPEGEAGETWANIMRPKLYAAMNVLNPPDSGDPEKRRTLDD